MSGATYTLGRKAPYAQTPIALLLDERSDAYAIAVYVALRSFCDIRQDNVSDEMGSKRAGCSPRTFRDRRNRLREMGWVDWDSGKGDGRANRYVVHETPYEGPEEGGRQETPRGSAPGAEGVGVRCRGGRQEAPRGSARDAAQEEVRKSLSPAREAEPPDVENSSGDPPGRDHELEEYLGPHAGAMEFLRSVEGYRPEVGLGLVRQYGPYGTQAHLWNGVPPDEQPGLLASAIVRAGSEAERFHGAFFARVLRSVIEDRLAPAPAEQAKARSAKSPVGRLTAEQEAERDAQKRAQAERRRALQQAQAEEQRRQEESREEAELLVWVEGLDAGDKAGLEEHVEALARADGWDRPPPKVIRRGYLVQAARGLREQELASQPP